MQPIYEHRQYGVSSMLVLSVIFTAELAVFTLGHPSRGWLPWIILLIFCCIAAYFYQSMTIRVDSEKISMYFGPGFPFLRVEFDKRWICSAQVVRNPRRILFGGVHFLSGTRVYNAYGLSAVEITLDDGSRIRFGSDEPDKLAQAIEALMWKR